MHAIYTKYLLPSSGLFFKQIPSPQGFVDTYKVFDGETEIGEIGINQDGNWLLIGGGDETFGTPYQAAAKLLETGSIKVIQSQLLREFKANGIEVLEAHGNEYIVRNIENDNHYVVRPGHVEVNQRCECADCYYRDAKCKHQVAVENFLFQRLLDKPFDELTASEWNLLVTDAATSLIRGV
ncbi:hypothetical protein ACE1AT_13225 [Pelatocladus sp. BLCC-F211]|uniref:hypothetical protein n=1 Tax=Pelatocladus sp. BLCC-F211 TaxID=3342752 RepID=UPI0035B99917